MTLPRPTNKPRSEIMSLAQHAIARQGGPEIARVFYKFDCDGCDARVRIFDPNHLPERAACPQCGTWTIITAGGFSLQMKHRNDVWRDPVDANVTIQKPYEYQRPTLITRDYK